MQNRTKLITAAVAALAIAGLAAACSSSSTTSGTETIHAAVTGSAAAANLNSNSNAPLSFPEGTYTGPVNSTVKPWVLPNSSGPVGTNTLPGGLRVHHVSTLPSASSNAPPPANWTLKGDTCYFTTTFDHGNYTVVPGSTGKFAGATGHGTYLITAAGWAPLSKGKTTCSFNNIGTISSQGASVTFKASGPLTVQS